MNDATVAIVGGGPAGIIAARRCLQEGLSVKVFEATSSIGGHWSSADDAPTGIYDTLKTNVTFFETAVSDVLPLRKGPAIDYGPASMFLSPKEMLEYLQHLVAITPGLADCVQLQTRVLAVRPKGVGYSPSRCTDRAYAITMERKGVVVTECYGRVIIAGSRTQVPRRPDIAGLEKHYKGTVIHSRQYRRASQFEGKSVLVVGGKISGSEVAGDLGNTPLGKGPTSVTMLTRRIRPYVAKERNGIPYSSVLFNPLVSLLVRSGARSLLSEIVRTSDILRMQFNTNEDYDLPPAAPRSLALTSSQFFLDAAKSAHKLSLRTGQIECITPRGAVRFDDGVEEFFDAIVFAYGYNIDLSMLDAEMESLVRVPKDKERGDVQELELYLQTWHHELPGCAFLGYYHVFGSTYLAFDLQARWIARCFAEVCLQRKEVEQGVLNRREVREHSEYVPYELSILHEWAAKVDGAIDYAKYPELNKCLLVGPNVPIQFGLFGRNPPDNAHEMYREAVRSVGFDVDSIQVSKQQLALLYECAEAFRVSGNMPNGFEKALKAIDV